MKGDSRGNRDLERLLVGLGIGASMKGDSRGNRDAAHCGAVSVVSGPQ